MVVAGIIFLADSPPPDLLETSLSSFEAVAAESIPMQFASSGPAFLREFFDGRTDFPVVIPDMADCTLLGGILRENPAGAVAEVLYAHYSQKIYLFETGLEGVLTGTTYAITDEVRDKLMADNTYARVTPEGRSVLLWRRGATLCTAVSDLSIEDLKYCLTSGDPGLLMNL
jgi:hypothetical protein